MSYNNLFKILNDNLKLKSLITNMSSGYVDIPYIVSETLKVLEDGHPFEKIISDSNKIALCNMIDKYFLDCWELYIDDLDLDKLVTFGKIEVYKVNAANGLRYATTGEIAQGIKGLLGEYIYPIGEEDYKKLCLLQWTFNGKSYFFRQAGYQLTYDDAGKVRNSFYEMITMCAHELNDLFNWLVIRDQFEKDIKILTKMKKNKGYKYASYEPDEITEDITIKQLIVNINRVFPRNSSNKDYRKALALVISSNKGKRLEPLEIAFLRNVYDKHALDRGSNKTISDDTDVKLKEMCEEIDNNRYSGKIRTDHFAYKIIDTLRKANYTKCSTKQYNILLDAYNLINGKVKKDEEKKEETKVISELDIDTSLGAISNALGDGLFDEEDE